MNAIGPDFLIIGTMKSGTTTLAFDLERSDQIAFPGGKEVKILASKEFNSDEQLIEAYFRALGTSDTAKLGDASPQYTMGKTEIVASRARKYLKPDLKLICILRNPILRAISHYKHVWQWTRTTFTSIDEAFKDPLFVETSLYSERLEPWLRNFERDRYRIIRFEDYVGNRGESLDELFHFLGVPAPQTMHTDTVLNSSENRYVLGKTAAKTRNLLRRLGINRPLSTGIGKVLLPILANRAPEVSELPNLDTLNHLKTLFQRDIARLQLLCSDHSLTWDLDATVELLAAKADSSARQPAL